MNNKVRVAWVDVLKFLGIFAIYIGHFGNSSGKLYPFVFTYHVPMFFFAAGFFAPGKADEKFLTFAQKKTAQLLLPYVFFSLIALLVFTILNDWGFIDFREAFKSFIFGIRNKVYAASLWFIPCLYIVVVIDYLFLVLFKSRVTTYLLALLAYVASQTIFPNNPVVNPSWIMNIDSAMYYYLYYVLGKAVFPLLKEQSLFFSECWLKKLLILITVLFVLANYFNGSDWLIRIIGTVAPSLQTFKPLTEVIYIFTILVLIFGNILLAMLLQKISLLQKLGRETLIFCGTENIFKIVLTQLLVLVGLKINLANPLLTIIFSFLCLLLCNYFVVKFLSEYFPAYVGKIKQAQ
ncbi:acyltransferase family protein [Undibacterium rugosum]|uniref:acyltransferase family protein n=1 Tax=Undibacterium rugosum TaxID=2762291 RepID=UPI001B81B6AA|nr:acyltransferase family protein [Undibacterium rugosum]MBR7779678.1 acyltransferase family protein [Undibacterium rugosum]